MAVVVGTNSWVTIAEADDYLTDRIDAADWFLLGDTDNPGIVSKTSLLVSAFHWLNTSATISSSSTDDSVKNAQIEAALFLQKHYTELDERRAAASMGVKTFRFSKRSEDLDLNRIKLPEHIAGLLAGYTSLNTFATLKGPYDV